MKELMTRMLSANPLKRPTAAEVINHPVFVNRTKIIMKPNKQLSKHMKDFKVLYIYM
jgi:calcium-dependent protein kinase